MAFEYAADLSVAPSVTEFMVLFRIYAPNLELRKVPVKIRIRH